MNEAEYKRTLTSWQEMRRRCYNPKRVKYAAYGARGIQVDPRWSSFSLFVEDMGARPAGHTLGRLDNDKDYTKENCRWETPLQQAANKGSYKNNTSGVKGVSWDACREEWFACATRNKLRRTLYRGQEFFEACCRRKSWENQHGTI